MIVRGPKVNNLTHGLDQDGNSTGPPTSFRIGAGVHLGVPEGIASPREMLERVSTAAVFGAEGKVGRPATLRNNKPGGVLAAGPLTAGCSTAL